MKFLVVVAPPSIYQDILSWGSVIIRGTRHGKREANHVWRLYWLIISRKQYLRRISLERTKIALYELYLHLEHHNIIFNVLLVISSLYGNISIDLDCIPFINLTWHCQWFCYWLELLHWVFMEVHLVLLVVWVCQKGRRNHHCKRELWIHLYKRHLSESISAFGLNDIKFWH